MENYSLRRKFADGKKGIMLDETGKLILVIVVLIVFFLALAMIFKPRIIDFFRNLPGFSQKNTNGAASGSGVSSPAPESVSAVPQCVAIANIGPLQGYQYIYFGGTKTNLYWEGSGTGAKIILYRTFPHFNRDVGVVAGGKISISASYLGGADFNSYKSELPSLADLSALNGAQYAAGNILCKVK